MKNNLTPEDEKFIINILRQGSVKWPGRSECLRRARKKVFARKNKKGQSVYKFHWQCATCKEWRRDEKDMEVDHIIEIGPFNGDWNYFIPRIYARQNNLQALCVICHMKKTRAYNSARSMWTRKR